MTTTPVIVMCRDRLAVTQELVSWLEAAGQQRIILVDIQSTYGPLLAWLAGSPHVVERLDVNLGHRAPWLAGIVERHAAAQPYIVTDCDVIPDEGCPSDAVSHLVDELRRHPELIKVGLSLRIDDIPDAYPRAAEVRHWEGRFYESSLTSTLWSADVDTTFAAYRPGVRYDTHPCARTKVPYTARHMPWYVIGEPSVDEAYYLRHARLGDTTWNLDQVPDWLRRELDGRRPARVPGRLERKARHIVKTRRWS